MRLIENWHTVLLRAYSVHFGAIAVICGLIDVLGNAWPLFEGVLPISPTAFALAGLAFGVIGLIGRFIKQPPISGDTNAP